MTITSEYLINLCNEIMRENFPNIKVNFELRQDGYFNIISTLISEEDYLLIRLSDVNVNELLVQPLYGYPLDSNFKSGDFQVIFHVVNEVNNIYELSHVY